MPTANLLSAQRAHSSIVHVLANWSTIAPTRPTNPLNGNDPAYHLSDIDALVRSRRSSTGFEVLMTIARHADVGERRQDAELPADEHERPDAVRADARDALQRHEAGRRRRDALLGLERAEPAALPGAAVRQSGEDRQPGGPTRSSTWPRYKGIKAGNPNALVAAGETSNRGHNHPTGGVSDSVAPATFARLLSEANPKLPFDAWATHPYPSELRARPDAEGRLSERRLLDDDAGSAPTSQKWFHRPIPIWVTEYGEQTSAGVPASGGVSYAKQAARRRRRRSSSRRRTRTSQMFIWFIFRDSTAQTWFSGVVKKNGTKKPSYSAFASAATGIVGHSPDDRRRGRRSRSSSRCR